MANWKETFRLYNGTALYTGQASNLSFRVSPYSSDIAGLTFTETPSSSGNYVCSGFSAYHKDAKLYLSGVEQTAFGIKNIGDPEDEFVSTSKATSQTLSGQLIASSAGYKTDVIVEKTSANGVSVDGLSIKDSAIRGTNPAFADVIAEYTSDTGVTIDGILIKDNIYLGHTGRALIMEANVVLVDPNRATALTKYIYKTIQDAIDFAQSQTPSSTSRWKILILSNKSNTGYNESITLYDYIDLYGIGTVKSGNISRSGTMSDKNCYVENMHFYNLDTSFVLRKTIFRNCTFMAEEDGTPASISNEGSQFTNCGFFIIGSGTITSTAHSGTYNRYFNCYGNYNIAFHASDGQINYGYDESITHQI